VVGRAASDQALLKANGAIRKMFAYRHDILKALINDGVKLVILGKEERISDLPEARGKDIDQLARFLEYSPDLKLIVTAEENVAADPSNPLSGDNQTIRLFAKALYDLCANRPVDPNWEKRGREVQQYELRVTRLDTRFKEAVEKLHETAGEKNLWKGTGALISPAEYWARGVLAYFDAAGQVHPPEGAPHPISTREQLREYDPALFELVHKTMAYEGHVDWRFRTQ
jgi:alpha-glucosidase